MTLLIFFFILGILLRLPIIIPLLTSSLPSESNPYAQPAADQSYELNNINNSNPYSAAPVASQAGGQQDDMISFFAEIDDIKKNLVQYDDNVERIESLHKRSLSEIGEDSEGWAHNQITSLTEETSALANTLRNRIKSLESRSQRDNTKKVQAENVKHQFKTSIRKYQAIEANFRQKYKERAERQYRIGE